MEDKIMAEAPEAESMEEEYSEITFDDLLQDPTYQAEFDRKVAKAMEKAKAKWVEESEKKRSEAEELAKMSADERHQHEISDLVEAR